MVDLPKVPRRLVTTEAPRSRVSGEVVGAPFAIAAGGLTALGEGIEAAGVRLAEEEGLRAVQTGPDGQPTFEPAPLFSGRAGEAYNRAARAKHFADFQTASERDYAKARLDFRGNPEGFAEWSESYNKTLVEKQKDERTKIAIEQHLSSISIQGHRAIAAEKQNLDIESSAATLKKRQELAENNIVSLYQQGAGPDTPEIKAYVADRAAILNERVANPLFRYSKQEREIDDQLFEVKTTALQLVGQVRRKAESDAVDENGKPLGGAQKAKEFAESLLTDPRLNLLSIEQRHHYYRLAVSEIRALDVENQGLVNQLNAEAMQWKKAIEKGEADPESVRDFLGRAANAKAIKGFNLVTNATALDEQLRGWFDRLSPEERTAVQLQLQGKLGDLADRIIRAESGGDPFSRATTSTATGLGQFTERTWISLVRRYKPEIWATAHREEILAMRNDPVLSREMVIRNADESRDALTKAGIKAGDREIYLAHFLGTPDAIKVLKAHSSQPLAELVQPESIAANEQVFARLRTAGDLLAWAQKKVGVPEIPTNVQSNPALLNAIHARRKQALAAAFPVIEKRINQTETINDEELEQFGALVFSVGTDGQKQKALELAVRLRAGSAYSTMTAQQRSDLLLEFSRVFSSGATKIDSDVGLYARQLNQDITNEYKNDPYSAAVRYGKRAPTPPIDFSNPESLGASLQARLDEQRWIRQNEGIGIFSLLRPAESETLAAHLATGDPAAVKPVRPASIRKP